MPSRSLRWSTSAQSARKSSRRRTSKTSSPPAAPRGPARPPSGDVSASSAPRRAGFSQTWTARTPASRPNGRKSQPTPSCSASTESMRTAAGTLSRKTSSAPSPSTFIPSRWTAWSAAWWKRASSPPSSSTPASSRASRGPGPRRPCLQSSRATESPEGTTFSARSTKTGGSTSTWTRTACAPTSLPSSLS